jgi:hypothetical protein
MESFMEGIFGSSKSGIEATPIDDIKEKDNAIGFADTQSAKKAKDEKSAELANKFSEEDVNIVKDLIFKGYATCDKKIDFAGGAFSTNVKLSSLTTNEYNFISQIITDTEISNLNKDGIMIVDKNNIGVLRVALRVCLQVVSFDDAQLIKSFNAIDTKKHISKMDPFNFCLETDSVKSLKNILKAAALELMCMDNHILTMLEKITIDFNVHVNNLMGSADLRKK